MSDPMWSRKQLADLLSESLKTMDRDSAVLHVAGIAHCDPVQVESADASRESRHAAGMEGGA